MRPSKLACDFLDARGTVEENADSHVDDYEIRFSAEDGKISLTISEFHNNDESAIQSARKSAKGREFEVWRGPKCVYGSRAAKMQSISAARRPFHKGKSLFVRQIQQLHRLLLFASRREEARTLKCNASMKCDGEGLKTPQSSPAEAGDRTGLTEPQVAGLIAT